MFNKKFNDTINKLEENLTDKKDLEFVKKQVTNLAMAYIDELTNIEKRYESRISFCENRIDELENHLLKLEKELFEDEDDIDFEPITCPYCNAHFMIEFDSDVTEMQCPDCNNTIELDWGEFEDNDDEEDDDM